MQHLMRKYGKWVLAILGVVLMVTWVGNLGSGRNRDQSGDDYVRGKIAGKSVKNYEFHQADAEINVLQQLRLLFKLEPPAGPHANQVYWFVLSEPESFRRLYQLLIMGADPEYYPFQQLPLGSRDPSLSWLLLTRESEKSGITATDSEVTSLLNGVGLSDSDLQDYVAKSKGGLTIKFIRQAISHMVAIIKLDVMAGSSVPVSLPELEYIADQLRSSVQVNYATLDADKAARTGATFPADQLQKQFDLYKGVMPSEGDQEPPLIDGHTYPFGYKWSDRVRIEFMKFDRADIRSRFKPTVEDVSAAYQYYQAHSDEFKNEAPISPGIMGPTTAPSTAPSTQPAIKTYEEVKTQLIQKQVDIRVDTVIKKMAERALALSQEAWKQQNTDAKGFRDALPADKWVSYNAIADDLAKQRDYVGYRPSVAAPDSLLSEKSLGNLASIGSAVFQMQREYVPFPKLAMHVKELDPAKDALSRLSLQVGLEGPMLIDDKGNIYVYRIIRAEKSQEPKSLDEVKNRVADDLARVEAFNQLKQQGEALATASRTGDLLALAKEKGFPAVTTEPFTRMSPVGDQFVSMPRGIRPSNVPGLGKLPEFVTAAFSLVNQVHVATPGNTRVDPTTTLPVERKLDVYVLELVKYEPLPIDQFNEQRWLFDLYAKVERRQEFMKAWSKLEALATRMNYTQDAPFGKDTDE